MSLWGALSTAWSVGRDVEGAVTAARTTLEVGGSPLDALRAFAAASENQLDDAATASLEDALRRALAGLRTAAEVAAWVGQQAPRVGAAVDGVLVATRAVHDVTGRVLAAEAEIRVSADRVLGVVGELGYQAGRVRAQLTAWG